jgi:4-hydroxy-tetrahydrodipicolinate reductase
MMQAPLRLLVHGANGRMGRALQRLCRDEPRTQVVAAVSRRVEARAVDGIPQFAGSELAGVPGFDVALDFSLPQGFDAILALCLARGAPLVSGTTGLSNGQHAALEAAAGRIPVAWASNFSLGVAVLHDLVTRAAQALPGWDCNVLEAHHAAKQDAPSGTALTLGEAAQAGGTQPSFASIRAGDIVGEHQVLFAAMGERLELVHRATNRDVFAHGALHVARRLVGRPPGRYRVADLL